MPGEKVLIIEDQRSNLVFLVDQVLRPNGYQVISAIDGKTGLYKALTENPDLIITDFRVPHMSGIEVLRQLNKAGKNIPVIISTFHGSEELAIEAFRLGARDYLIKPYEVDQMVVAIRRALTSRPQAPARDLVQDTNTVRINRQLERRIRELIVLSGIGKAVTSLHEIEAVLERILQAATYLTQAQEAFLMLIDPESNELYMRAIQGMDKKYRLFRQKVDDSMAGMVVRTGRPVRIGREQPQTAHEVVTGHLVRDLLNVPLEVHHKVIGVLGIDNITPGAKFSENDEYLLSALAGYAAIAINNASMIATMEQRIKDLSTTIASQASEHNARQEMAALARQLQTREQRINAERQEIAQAAEELGNLYFRIKAIDARITGPAHEQD